MGHLEEISGVDLRHLGTFVVGACEWQEKRGEVDRMGGRQADGEEAWVVTETDEGCVISLLFQVDGKYLASFS